MKNIIKTLVKKVYYGTPYTWRVPKVYYDTLKEIDGLITKDEIETYQLKKLKSIVAHAYENVPGYHQLYSEAGVKPSDIQTLGDIKLLPQIEKELMRENISDFTARNVARWKLHQSRTSGSTGAPLGFYKTSGEEWVEQAFVGRGWSQGGWNIHQSGFMLRGAYAGDAEHIVKKCDNGNFYVHNNSYLVSPNYLTEEYYPVYREFLKKHNELEYIFALPSSISLLAQLIIDHHDEGISNVKAIYLGSESIYNWQYDFIRKAFPKANIISLYGQTERVIMAYWCKDNQKYHIDPFYGVTEILDGNREVNAGERGELIGTSFWNTTTPFIRYRTIDYAIKGADACDKCGLNYGIIDTIEGRLQDVLIGATDRIIAYTAFDGSLLHGKVFKDIIKYKIVQTQKGELDFLLQVKDGFSEEKQKEFEGIISDYLGDDFTVKVTIVDEILPGKNGKFNIVEQHLPIDISTRVKI